MTTAERLVKELDVLVEMVVAARTAGISATAVVDVLDGALPGLRQLRGQAWLEAQAKTLKPRKPRDTAARRRRALLAELTAVGS
jgi:hypothetical protein